MPYVAKPLEYWYVKKDMGYTSLCWIWTGAIAKNGYARWNISGTNKSSKDAHRVVYVKYKGQIPTGMELDHLCRIKNCVNPEHLEIVTHQENCIRRSKNVRRKRQQQNSKS